jgi:hypothetical protein
LQLKKKSEGKNNPLNGRLNWKQKKITKGQKYQKYEDQIRKNKTQQTWIEGWYWKQIKPWQKGQGKKLEIKKDEIGRKEMINWNWRIKLKKKTKLLWKKLKRKVINQKNKD